MQHRKSLLAKLPKGFLHTTKGTLGEISQSAFASYNYNM
jgi:hypothetical protein